MLGGSAAPSSWETFPTMRSCLEALGSSNRQVVKPIVRLIDDLSASGVNGTVQVEPTPPLHTLDVVAAVSREITRQGQGGLWLGKTFDLSAAYRQLYISSDSLWSSFLVVYDPIARRPTCFSLERFLSARADQSTVSSESRI